MARNIMGHDVADAVEFWRLGESRFRPAITTPWGSWRSWWRSWWRFWRLVATLETGEQRLSVEQAAWVAAQASVELVA
jgi:hypothetical protein